MLTVSRPGRRDGAGLGIFATRIAGVRCYGHPGYWGTEAYACPALEMAFTIATNQADEAKLDTTPVQRTIVAVRTRRPSERLTGEVGGWAGGTDPDRQVRRSG